MRLKYTTTSAEGNKLELIIGFDLSSGPDRCFFNGVEIPMPEELKEALESASRKIANEIIEEMVRGSGDTSKKPIGINSILARGR